MINEVIAREHTNGFFYKIKDQENKTRGYLLGIILAMDPYVKAPKKLSDIALKKVDKSSTLIVKFNFELHENHNNLVNPEQLHFKMDYDLQKKARKDKKAIIELETIDYYIEIGQKTGREILRNFQINPQLLQEISAYAMRQFELDEREMVHAARLLFSPESAKECFDDRQAKLADKINVHLLERGKHMVAIDASNLLGEHGVKALLAEKYGWRIEKIQKDVFVF